VEIYLDLLQMEMLIFFHFQKLLMVYNLVLLLSEIIGDTGLTLFYFNLVGVLEYFKLFNYCKVDLVTE
jgi:hypothetical protein